MADQNRIAKGIGNNQIGRGSVERLSIGNNMTIPAKVPNRPKSKPELVAKMGVGKPHANNNRIERLNGTLRERVKVQRGWKTMKTPLAEGQRIHYNFVKPHMALEGQTPAQVAGIGVNGRNKWMELLSRTVSQETREN